jgi:hypothetical protein
MCQLRQPHADYRRTDEGSAAISQPPNLLQHTLAGPECSCNVLASFVEFR